MSIVPAWIEVVRIRLSPDHSLEGHALTIAWRDTVHAPRVVYVVISCRCAECPHQYGPLAVLTKS